MWTDLGFEDLGYILKVEPMGLDRLKRKRTKERVEYRMASTFSAGAARRMESVTEVGKVEGTPSGHGTH